jgi:hypothetical protein
MTADATTLMQQEWKEAGRRLEADRADRARYERLLAQVDVVLEELRKNVGHTYTVAYRDAESWARAAVADRASSSGWPRDLALVVAAAFHAYERGAVDYQR